MTREQVTQRLAQFGLSRAELAIMAGTVESPEQLEQLYRSLGRRAAQRIASDLKKHALSHRYSQASVVSQFLTLMAQGLSGPGNLHPVFVPLRALLESLGDHFRDAFAATIPPPSDNGVSFRLKTGCGYLEVQNAADSNLSFRLNPGLIPQDHLHFWHQFARLMIEQELCAQPVPEGYPFERDLGGLILFASELSHMLPAPVVR